MALRLTQNTNESEELIQELWIIAIRKLPEFEWRSELRTWLIGILINLSKAQYQKRKNHEEMVDKGNTNSFESNFQASYDLEKAIGQLPRGYREVFILHDIDGYKHKEIAGLLNVTEGTSKSQLFQARKALREYLEADKYQTK